MIKNKLSKKDSSSCIHKDTKSDDITTRDFCAFLIGIAIGILLCNVW